MTVCFITALGIARLVLSNQRLRPVRWARTSYLLNKISPKSTNVRLRFLPAWHKRESRGNRGPMVCFRAIFACSNFNKTIHLQ